MEKKPIITDLDVLREMVRLAEKRREEELQIIEKVNKYNLALIAFAGSFLSLLVTVTIDKHIVQLSGFFLFLSIIVSLIAVRPMTLKGGTLLLDQDVKTVRDGLTIHLNQFLLEAVDILDRANSHLGPIRHTKVRLTIASAMVRQAHHDILRQ